MYLSMSSIIEEKPILVYQIYTAGLQPYILQWTGEYRWKNLRHLFSDLWGVCIYFLDTQFRTPRSSHKISLSDLVKSSRKQASSRRLSSFSRRQLRGGRGESARLKKDEREKERVRGFFSLSHVVVFSPALEQDQIGFLCGLCTKKARCFSEVFVIWSCFGGIWFRKLRLFLIYRI